MKILLIPFSFFFLLVLSWVFPSGPSKAKNPTAASNEAIVKTSLARGAGYSQDEFSRSSARLAAFKALISKAQSDGSVRVIVGLQVAGFKAEGKLRSEQAASNQRQAIASAQKALLTRLSSFSVNVDREFEFIPFIAITVDLAALQQMELDDEVVSIEENIAVPPLLAESVPLIGAPTAWAAGFTGSGQTVAILDTGVDKTHPFLAGKVVSEACFSTTNSNSTSLCPGGVDSTSTGSGVNCVGVSGCDHGTHVAGIATGKGTNSGVAKDANIIAIQVFSRINAASCPGGTAPCLSADRDDLIAGLERVFALRTTFNIAAVNMSLGGGQHFSNCDSSDPSFKAAVDNLRSVGTATVIASGNNGFKDSIASPACISSAVSVGSTGDGSNGAIQDVVVTSSNSANFLSLLAPGRWINSSVPGGGFANFDGTSMATPHVAGAWAVMKSKKPTATVDEVLTALKNTGLAITDVNGITKPRIKLDAAINAIGGGSCTFALNPTSRSFAAAGGSNSFSVTTGSGCPWTATVNAPSSSMPLLPPTKGKTSLTSPPQEMTIVPSAPQTVFLNSNPITIVDRSSNSNPPGTASLYPSTINVSGMTGNITLVQAALNGVSHTFPDDIDVVLVGPGGQRAVLMSDVGGSLDLAGVDLIFEQTATAMPDATQLVSGTYRPTNFNTNTTLEPGGIDIFPAPGPGQNVYTSDLSVFNGTSPNGDWKIYVVDDEQTDPGNIASGWALGIVTSGGGTSWVNITSGSSGSGNGTVNYTVAANSGQSPRTGTITVGGQTHTITQAGSGGGCPSPSISSGQTITGSLTTSDCLFSGTTRQVDLYSFNGTAGQQVVVTMTSSNFDTYLYLLNSSNQAIAEDDDGGLGTNSRIPTNPGTFTLPATGSYTIYATSFSAGETGDYSLSLGNGNRLTTAGLHNPSSSTFFLRNSNSAGTASLTFGYGPAGANWIPLVGDWDGNGIDTPGLYNPTTSTFFLRNSNSAGSADLTFVYGPAGANWTPLVGDWNGDGTDTVGLYQPSTAIFFLKNSNSAGSANLVFSFGPAGLGWLPLAGDWNGDGVDTVGLYQPSSSAFFLRNSNSAGSTDIAFIYGPAGAGWTPVVGDWNQDRTTTAGLYNPATATFFLRNANASGVADLTFSYGPAGLGWRPLAGDWDGQ